MRKRRKDRNFRAWLKKYIQPRSDYTGRIAHTILNGTVDTITDPDILRKHYVQFMMGGHNDPNKEFDVIMAEFNGPQEITEFITKIVVFGFDSQFAVAMSVAQALRTKSKDWEEIPQDQLDALQALLSITRIDEETEVKALWDYVDMMGKR